MATAAAENNPLPLTESKTARKKKAKAEATSDNATAVPEAPTKESSDPSADSNGVYEHAHVKELQKRIRNINKRLAGLQKTDAVIAENAGVSLDELVKQKKINADQKAAAENKPQLQAQVQQYEEQVKVFRDINADYQAQMQKQKETLEKEHHKELEKAREDANTQATSTGAGELKRKLLVFSQFLRAAAAKRTIEEDIGSSENMAFEGALLLVYGGDEKAVETAMSIIEGSAEPVPDINGTSTAVKYSQIRQSSIDHAPFQTEEAWVDSVNEANAADAPNVASKADAAQDGSDPTIAHAGLNELNGASAEAQGEVLTSPVQGTTGDEAGNAAGDRWDTSSGAQQGREIEDSYEMIPRPNEEVDTPASASAAPAQQEKVGSWADESAQAAAHGDSTSGNKAGEGWDLKAAGSEAAQSTTPQTNGQVDTPTGTPAPGEADDGFQQIPNRHQPGRGRGGRGGFRGDGEFRGRGRGRGGFRGDRGGEGGFRGDGTRGGRGGFRGDRAPRGDGEFRGRGGRGRGGPRGGAEGQPVRS